MSKVTIDTSNPKNFPELAGFTEAADILGVKTGNLSRLAGLPEPVARLKGGSIWLAEPLRELAEKRKAAAKPQT